LKVRGKKMSNKTYSQRLNDVIPGGAHTYSRGDDQFPDNAPEILVRGIGSRVYDPQGTEYLDYGMALRAVTLGYSNNRVNAAAIQAIEHGNGLTRASLVELEAAELLVDCVRSVDMVKFTKNGSSATSAAVKLARAYTGRDIVLRCAQHPFFSYDDWFIGSTPIKRGIPEQISSLTKTFDFNNITSLAGLIKDYPGQISCVIMEPAGLQCPLVTPDGLCCGQANCKMKDHDNFLQQVEAVCRLNGIIFILDETITGFRWGIGGAQERFNVSPDLTTFGKGMANGFSVAAVGGKRDIMELGSINIKGAERVFLLSTTHGAEMSGLGAFIETVKILKEGKVIPHLWDYGEKLVQGANALIHTHGLKEFMKFSGPAPSPNIIFEPKTHINPFELRTLFLQELLKMGVLMPWVSISYSHTEDDLKQTMEAMDTALKVCRQGIELGIDSYLESETVKPVFRKYN
jgi:glutamate-1-semialdehyde 2,1-aminomutase